MRVAALSWSVSGALLGLSTLTTGAAMAGQLTVSAEIPRLNVAEYHRPYVAIWLENKADKSVTNLAVWYDVKLKNNEGTKWLKDMRQWWRSSGRDLTLPKDGLSGATRAPGTHEVSFSTENSPLGSIAAGDYVLLIEAAREVGGREILKLPLQIPAGGSAEAKGQHELGQVKVRFTP